MLKSENKCHKAKINVRNNENLSKIRRRMNLKASQFKLRAMCAL
jgi:hypothetical protein